MSATMTQRTLLVYLATIALVATAALSAPAAQSALISSRAARPKPRTTLPIIERQVMCVTCKIPLDVAESPQANLERQYIQGLINKGQGEAEIKRSLVAQYGPTVLGLPSTHGFDLVAYLVPIAVVLALIGALVVLLPRWRRHARTQAAHSPGAVTTLSSDDAARLESDLARFD
jgi:cytochrome c-type biogenesis protein CcmH